MHLEGEKITHQGRKCKKERGVHLHYIKAEGSFRLWLAKKTLSSQKINMALQ